MHMAMCAFLGHSWFTCLTPPPFGPVVTGLRPCTRCRLVFSREIRFLVQPVEWQGFPHLSQMLVERQEATGLWLITSLHNLGLI